MAIAILVTYLLINFLIGLVADNYGEPWVFPAVMAVMGLVGVVVLVIITRLVHAGAFGVFITGCQIAITAGWVGAFWKHWRNRKRRGSLRGSFGYKAEALRAKLLDAMPKPARTPLPQGTP